MYNKDHGIIAMSCHLVLELSTILKLHQMQCSNVTTQSNVPQTTKKKQSSMTSIFYFFNSQPKYKKINLACSRTIP